MDEIKDGEIIVDDFFKGLNDLAEELKNISKEKDSRKRLSFLYSVCEGRKSSRI